jgi:Asp-tRNA(Asn)/Glu-tRNA(Gln) amidotransferase A subunit family amidase
LPPLTWESPPVIVACRVNAVGSGQAATVPEGQLVVNHGIRAFTRNGFPVGITLIGPAWHDAQLASFAAALHRTL